MADITINGVKYTSTNSKTPYTEIASAYANQARASMQNQLQSMGSQLATSKAGTAANYDRNAAQAYLNYAKQQNALPEQLRAQGINGGASESALVRIANNYAQNAAANNASRSSAMSQLQNTYDTNVANLRQTTEDNINSQNLALAQQQAQYTDTLNQRALEQFSATIERYTSTGSVDKALKALNKNDPNYTAMKQLLELRKAQLKTGKSSKSSGSGSKSYSSGTKSTSSSKKSSNVASKIVKKTVKAASGTKKVKSTSTKAKAATKKTTKSVGKTLTSIVKTAMKNTKKK